MVSLCLKGHLVYLTFTFNLFSGFALSLGTYVECKIIQFMKKPRPHKTEIDDLILFEQQVNLVNGPVILMQLLRDAIQCCSEIPENM